LAHHLEPDLARHAPMKLATGEFALCLVPTWIVNGGAAVWKNCSTWSLAKMIHRSGRRARNRVPISAAAVLTRSTVSRSSVSGIVKNCGA